MSYPLRPWEELPEWLQHAAHNDPEIYQVVKDWRMTSRPLTVLFETIAKRLYERSKLYREETLKRMQQNPNPYVLQITPEQLEHTLPKNGPPHHINPSGT